MANDVTWLLLGAGNIAKIRAGAALRDAVGSKLVAICDRDRDRAEALATQLQLSVPIYSDYDQALAESSAEAVYIATQAPAHVPCSLKAMAAGKHFLCEKPLGMDGRDAAPLYQAAKNSPLVCSCSDYRRLSEHIKLVENLVQSGELGELTFGWMNWFAGPRSCGNTPLSRAAGGSPLKTLAFYIFDIAHNLFGIPVGVQAAAARHFNPSNDTEDVSAIIMRFPNGALFSLNVMITPWAGSDRIEFHGTDGSIIMDKWPPAGNGPIIINTKAGGRRTVTPQTNTNWHIPMIEDFCRAIRQKRAPVCSIRSAYITELITDAVFRAMDSGKEEKVLTEGLL